MPRRPGEIEAFRQVVLGHYAEHARDLPWRHTRDPYAILVSEVMLQQTQVARVACKYDSFLDAFPTVAFLAQAPTAEVLSLWQGLGYNRRALALQQSARLIENRHGGRVPESVDQLRSLPGIGAATAAAVCVYAFGRPLPFIETNIRSAFLHFFFQECSAVSDAELLPLVELALDRDNPRDWYYALMDYGSFIKKTVPNPGRRSRHYSQQSRFAGSPREARGAIVRALLEAAPSGLSLKQLLSVPVLSLREKSEVMGLIEHLTEEGFLIGDGDIYLIA